MDVYHAVAFWKVVGLLCTALFLYGFCLVTYRLWLSPLSHFPGPKLLAATGWYESLVDVTSNNFHEVLLNMHKKYGKLLNPLYIFIVLTR